MKKGEVKVLVLIIIALIFFGIASYASVMPTKKGLKNLIDKTGFDIDGKEDLGDLDTPQQFFDFYNNLLKNCMKVETDDKCVCGELSPGYLQEGDFIIRNFYRDGKEMINLSLMYATLASPDDYRLRIGKERLTEEYEAKYCSYFTENQKSFIASDKALTNEMDFLGQEKPKGSIEKSMIKFGDEHNNLFLFYEDIEGYWMDFSGQEEMMKLIRLEDGTICNTFSYVDSTWDYPSCKDAIDVLENFDYLVEAITASLDDNFEVEYFLNFPDFHEIWIRNQEDGINVSLQVYKPKENVPFGADKIILAEHLFEGKQFILYSQELVEDQFLNGKWSVEDTSLDAFKFGKYLNLSLDGTTILQIDLTGKDGVIDVVFPEDIEDKESWDILVEDIQEYFGLYEDLDLVYEKSDLGESSKNCERKEWLGVSENFCTMELQDLGDFTFNVNFLNLTTSPGENWNYSIIPSYEYYLYGEFKGDASEGLVNKYFITFKYRFNSHKFNNLGSAFVFINDEFYDDNNKYLTIMGFDDGR
jgi:hypothetical protein